NLSLVKSYHQKECWVNLDILKIMQVLTNIISNAIKALEKFGAGSGASRLLAGGVELHSELERKIAKFKNTPSALIFNSGYAANTGIIPALFDNDFLILSDELNHASIIDGCRLSKAETKIYKHRDIEHLEKLLKTKNKKQKIVITDSVFSMDGDIAPLDKIYELCKKYNALLYIDDAHGTGVLGKGKGALSHFRLKSDSWIIQMGTFSKALGSYGAFLAGSKDVIKLALNTVRTFIFSTALPAYTIAASLAAIELIEKDTSLIEKLWQNRKKVVSSLSNLGFDLMNTETPIIPLKMKDIDEAIRLSVKLFKKGIYAPAIRPPTVKEPRLRITVTAAHTDKDIGTLIDALKTA
ncbi:TPA: aminotransferase class I/II-fold pyridoxal phosphate-dependent enzyme, partial [bacterium]|nr:aminotransferase class I/II-fold pyridoxal phosphate-dependent enzyme [bacterium]